jgi:Ala-tRNA(Pro) deacylase
MKDQILDFLAKLDIPYRWVDHPAVFTVAESLEHIEGKRPIKNLLLQEKGNGRKILIIMDGGTRLDTKLIEQKLDAKKLQFAKPEVLEQTFGVAPGAVSVFGLLHVGATDVEVVVDQSLLSEPELGFHPNDNTATIFLPGSSLEKILKATAREYSLSHFS